MNDTIVHTEPMTTDLAVDLPWERLREYLHGEGLSLSNSVPPRRFTGGFGNLNFLVEIDDQHMVLRRPPPGPLPPGGNDMEREFAVLSRLWEVFELAPRARLFCGDPEVFGAPFLLIDYCHGRVVREAIPEEAVGLARQMSEMLIDTLARLHSVDPEDVGLGGLGRPEGFLARTIEGWFKRAEVATEGQAPAATEDLVEWLRDNCLPEGDVTLIHNDFKLNNIVLDPQRLDCPRAVLDWDMCTRGDPLFDLATLLSYWVEPEDPVILRELKQMPLAEGKFMSREAAAERYAAKTGRDLSDFVFHRVLAMFKLGVVFLQLHSRYRRGQAADERYAGFRKLAEGVLDFSLEVSAGKVF